MRRRLRELRELRPGLGRSDPASLDAARSVGQSLRGSGATYGYPRLSSLAAMVESAPAFAVARRVEGLVEHLREIAAGDDARGVGAEWLVSAATGRTDHEPERFEDLETAWREISTRERITATDLARRVAELFGLQLADFSRSTAGAVRLVPEALIRSDTILPLREDSETITVATADPTSLEMEDRLLRLTGRTPVFEVASPDELRRAIEGLLGGNEVLDSPQRDVPRALDATDLIPDALDERGAGRILIVDDDPDALVVTRNVLTKGGYDVDEAADGIDALARLEADDGISVVVADLHMPRMDGLELIWELRAQDQTSRPSVIVVTGETDEVLETRLIEEGADDYIRKPLDPRLFLARVAATIRRAEQ